MTLDLDKLKALCDAATPGPWTTHTPGCDPYARICGWSKHHEPEGPAGGISATGPDVCTKEEALRDAAFIAAARTAVPELIAEVERLRTVYNAAETIRNGRYSVRSRLTSRDRTAFDVFNQAIDAALAAKEKAK